MYFQFIIQLHAFCNTKNSKTNQTIKMLVRYEELNMKVMLTNEGEIVEPKPKHPNPRGKAHILSLRFYRWLYSKSHLPTTSQYILPLVKISIILLLVFQSLREMFTAFIQFQNRLGSTQSTAKIRKTHDTSNHYISQANLNRIKLNYLFLSAFPSRSAQSARRSFTSARRSWCCQSCTGSSPIHLPLESARQLMWSCGQDYHLLQFLIELQQLQIIISRSMNLTIIYY